MNDVGRSKWGLASAMRDGVRNLFPTRKTKSAMWGVVGLGVLITYMELMAAILFSRLITNIGEQSAQTATILFGGFLLTFAAVKGISYFQSVYRLTVFEKAFRQLKSAPGAAEAWRWPMAISLVGMMGQIARLSVVTVTVMVSSWVYGTLLTICSVIAIVIVNRTGRKQYEIHHGFVEAKKSGRPPSAAERIVTRIRAGEKAGLLAVGPILFYVAALGFGAANGRVSAHSALVLFVAGRMASNMYGTLSNESMRFLRAQVYVEAYGESSPVSGRSAGIGGGAIVPDEQATEKMSSGGYIWEPPTQAFAHLIDDGYMVGDPSTLGRLARQAGFGPNDGLRKHAPSPGPDKIVAVAPNQVWLHGVYSIPVVDTEAPNHLQVVSDAFSRKVVAWHLGHEAAYGDIEPVFHEACRLEGITHSDVKLHTSAAVFGTTPNIQDLLKSLGVVRTLLWAAPVSNESHPRPDRPAFPTRFATEAAAKAWIDGFVTWYNEIFYQPDVGYLHPSDVHCGLADVITMKRQGTLDAVLADSNDPLVGGMPETWLPPEEAWVERVSITTVSRENQSAKVQDVDEDEEL